MDSEYSADYLKTAIDIGQSLINQAIWSGDACAFHGAAIDALNHEQIIHKVFDGSLYDGSIGVARFLAYLGEIVDDELVLNTARGALRHAIEFDTTDMGLFSGLAGIALTARELSPFLETSEEAKYSTEKFISTLENDFEFEQFDLTSGIAGVLYALASIIEDDEFSERARSLTIQLVEKLVEISNLSNSCMSWSEALGEQGDSYDLCGLAHGASGSALAFERLTKIFPKTSESWKRYASKARCYERCWFMPEQSTWPDLRTDNHNKQGAYFWCHGAVGIGIERMIAASSDNKLAMSEAQAALAGTSSYIEFILSSPEQHDTFSQNMCLCHGLGGAMELFILAAHKFNSKKSKDLALKIAKFGQEQYAMKGTWSCGVLGGGETPGLMTGLAGIGMIYLRLCDMSKVPLVSIPGRY